MPGFELKKYPKGFKVVDDDGREYSKRVLSEKRAKAQMKALYAAYNRGDFHRGAGYTMYGQGKKHITIYHGAGWFGNVMTKIKGLANRAAQKVFSVAANVVGTQVRVNYPPKVRAAMAKYGSGVVEELLIRRAPVMSMVDKALNLISFGKWNEAKQKYAYDKLFHLSMIAALRMPDGQQKRVVIEKNEVINIGDKFKTGGEEEYYRVHVPCCITFGTLIEKGKELRGDAFFKYDAFQNNCQDFLISILTANGLLTPESQAFIKQDVGSLVQELPSYISPFANLTTNIAGLADRVLEGEGRGGKVCHCVGPSKCGGTKQYTMGAGTCCSKSAAVAPEPEEFPPIPEIPEEPNKPERKDFDHKGTIRNGRLHMLTKDEQDKAFEEALELYEMKKAEYNKKKKRHDDFMEYIKNNWYGVGEGKHSKLAQRLGQRTMLLKEYNEMYPRYEAAVARGDLEEAKRLRDRSAQLAEIDNQLYYSLKNKLEKGYGKPRQYTMPFKDYMAEHKKLIAVLDDIAAKATALRNKQANEPAFKKGKGKHSPLAKAVMKSNQHHSDIRGIMEKLNEAPPEHEDALLDFYGKQVNQYWADKKRMARKFEDGSVGVPRRKGRPAAVGPSPLSKKGKGKLHGYGKHYVDGFCRPKVKGQGLRKSRMTQEQRDIRDAEFAEQRRKSIADMAANPEKYKPKSYDSTDGGRLAPCWIRRALDRPEGGLSFGHLTSMGMKEPEECAAIQQAQIAESDRRQYNSMSGFQKFAKGFVDVATKVADFAVKPLELVPGVGRIASQVYQNFAPPGSEYYGDNLIKGVQAMTQGEGKPSDKFMKQLKKLKISPAVYIAAARAAGKKHGYKPEEIQFALNNEHKLTAGGTPFGRAGYGDFIIYTLTKNPIADQKRNTFQKSHSKIKGDWKADKYSANNLALRVLW